LANLYSEPDQKQNEQLEKAIIVRLQLQKA